MNVGKYGLILLAIRDVLTPDLLKPEWRRRRKPGDPRSKGHCYAACEALWHLTGKKLKPKMMRLSADVTHWWLESGDMIFDPTWDQFKKAVPYEKGRGCGFLTEKPSRRAAEIIRRVRCLRKTSGF